MEVRTPETHNVLPAVGRVAAQVFHLVIVVFFNKSVNPSCKFYIATETEENTYKVPWNFTAFIWKL